MEEIWKDVVGWEKSHKVSNLGNVKSKQRYTNGRHGITNINEKLLSKSTRKQPRSDRAEVMCSLCWFKQKKTYYISRLVAQAFIPNPENKSQVNHIDGNTLNNHVLNLEWVTPSENVIHAYKNGLTYAHKGEDNAMCKISNKTILTIKSLMNKGVLNGSQIAKLIGVNKHTIYDIKRGRRSVPKPPYL